ncbi:MAG: thrombospondin [Myxococcales bacterium]|nr:thrombospondin [Myxococcales bacterium]
MRTTTLFNLGTRRWRLAGVLGVFGTVFAAASLTSCVSDPDCGVCDPDNLYLQSIAGVNYAGKIVKLLGPECVGDACPGEITSGSYFVEKVIPCIETDEAIEAGRGVEEFCKVSPLVVDSGLQFIFNNLLDPQSVELTRKQPANPQLLEVFDWKTHVVHLEGPITRFNGDYRPGATQTKPDTIERSTNLACIENLAKMGTPYDHTADPAICDGTYKAEDGKVWPLKAILEREGKDGKLAPAVIDTYDGETDARRQSQACTTPQSGPDTCCDACDYELAVNVYKYGADNGGDRVAFEEARTCSPDGDKYQDCRGFIPFVDRSEEVRRYAYAFGDQSMPGDGWRLPMQDKLRETHPDDRPEGFEQKTVSCTQDADCTSDEAAGLDGMECVGVNAEGEACSQGDDCVDRKCVAEWFVDCRADTGTTGSQGYCVDVRWSGQGTAACFTNTKSYYVCESTETCADEVESNSRRQGAGSRFAYADSNTNGRIEAIEGCRDDKGNKTNAPCDPLNQASLLKSIDRYDRKETLPSATRNCICEEDYAEGCESVINDLCREDSDPAKKIRKDREGQYAMKFVTRNGGVIYDPAVKGVIMFPADLGLMTRSLVENCSAARASGAGGLSIKDGWRANDNGGELFANYDKAMCSSSTYRVLFNTPPENGDPIEYIKDKVGNALKGKSEYVLRTPDFHVIPGSGFPTDNLRIGACDDFEIRFSNKYDMSEVNLKKLQIWEITEPTSDKPSELISQVAGGIDCAENPDTDSGLPCLTVNVRDQEIGAVRVSIDTQKYGAAVLQSNHRYRLVVPGLDVPDNVYSGGEDAIRKYMFEDPDRYKAAFWDACGMPLITGMPPIDAETGKIKSGAKQRDNDFYYDFLIDDPKPKEDKEQDGVQFSCDNAPDFYNPLQEDMDEDGYGDIDDLCPSVPAENNMGDTDKDGIGNPCDLCTRLVANYNENAGNTPVYMQVRNIPVQQDYDQDGIGDVCDNCIVRGNCGGFGPSADGLRPAGIGDVVPFNDDDTCQIDVDDLPYVGDACAPDGVAIQDPGAAGPVGHLDTDDFDQDGIRNIDDFCPRIRIDEVVACTANEECAENSECTNDGVCNHVDTDNDGVGDICDTCPEKANNKQVLDGGMQEDDPDGDFVGNACETNSACYDNNDPRRLAFYSESANGQCCVMLFDEAATFFDPGYAKLDEDDPSVCTVMDPAVQLKLDCPEDQENVTCRKIPDSVANTPGVGRLPAGCSGIGEPLDLNSPGINGDSDKLHQYACLMPQFDQDFDGVGDKCDLCPYAFDPNNEFYKDQNNKLWPNIGKFCRGEYDPEKEQVTCEDLLGDTDTDTDTGGADTGGTGETG